MNELKTLMDLEYCVSAKENEDAIYLYKTVDIIELKEEINKWILYRERIDIKESNKCRKELIKWIRKFFNV